MGATELLSRYKSQNSDVARMVSDLEKIKTSQIGPIRHEQSQLSVKYRQFKDKHNEQARRLTKLLRDVEVLRNRGRPLHNEEIKHREEYDRAIVVKSGFEGKLLQLENLTAAYSAEVGENAENEQFEDMTDYDLHAIYELLSRQHEGILHLTHILDKDLRDAEIMAQGLRCGGGGEEGEIVGGRKRLPFVERL
jgi:type I site-specific restriction endonuclease